MKTRKQIPVVAASFAALTLISNLHAQPLVNIETVTVGDAGNAADSTGYGAVNSEFNIGKYEVTVGQYTTFLNTVASVTSDSYIINLWDPNMQSITELAGVGRSGSGSVLSPFVYSAIGTSSRPVAFVDWFDAARFANWMNNGATNGASTETGAYTLNGATTGIIRKNPEATWWIPSEDEWYKAAYYKGGSTNAGYWLYPTQSDVVPIAQPNTPGGTNSANFASVLQGFTEVGSYTNSPSAYGTFDQGGNNWEWNDATDNTFWVGGLRGGNNYSWAEDLSSLSRNPGTPSGYGDSYGFRVASVPEPSTYALLLMTGAGALWWARGRR